MLIIRPKLAVSVVAALLISAAAALPATPVKLSGSIAGVVRSTTGVPQMGASVLLFNRSERLIEQAITNEHGLFAFQALTPDFYSIRVSLASFVPAVKQKISVQPGIQSLLYVNMASVLSSIELVNLPPGQGALMSDDWKWVLKQSASTRPVLRLLPGSSTSDPKRRDKPVGSVFSDTRGVLSLSAGEPGSLGASSTQADLGTAFALATSVFGRNQLELSGNVGYSASTALPAAGFRTTYSRGGTGPEIAVTVQQVYLPARGGQSANQPGDSPALRSMSVSMRDSIALSDNIRLDYGGSLDSVSFLDRMNYLSNYARLTDDLGRAGTVRAGFSTGAPPTQLLVETQNSGEHVRGDSDSLAQDLAALALLPRISLLDGRAAVQRSRNLEVGYEKKFQKTTVGLTGYHETVTNAAMTLVAPDGLFAAGDVLPDISSQSSVLDAGSFQRAGFAASVTQALGDRVQVGSSFGSSGGLTMNGQDLPGPSADALRSNLRTTQRFWASARASAIIPVTGTVISGSYQWMNYNDVVMPDHFYLTQNMYSETGLNVRVRQPIPALPGMPGRLEATADLLNGLAQGYLPLTEAGQRIVLAPCPRALRGGLSFIF